MSSNAAALPAPAARRPRERTRVMAYHRLIAAVLLVNAVLIPLGGEPLTRFSGSRSPTSPPPC